MKEDDIEKLLKNSEIDFDIETPEVDHEHRFLIKLKSQNILLKNRKAKPSIDKSIIAIAASIILCFGLFLFIQNKPESKGLASVSPELSQTQDFFTTAIHSELNKVQEQRIPENETLISDALKQMKILETNYERLSMDLKQSGHDKRVIYAMISNFQSRIDILQNVLTSIEGIKQLKLTEQTQMTL